MSTRTSVPPLPNLLTGRRGAWGTLLLAVLHGQERLRLAALMGAVLALLGVASLSLSPLRDGVPVLSSTTL